MGNPYGITTMIRETKYFFGRKNEINRIIGMMGGSRPRSISIVGDDKIGKSSLLYYIFQLNKEKMLFHTKKYIFVFVNFQQYPNITVNGFFKILYSELKHNLPSKIEIKQAKDYDTFLKMIHVLDYSGYKLILLFDEFDRILQNENFGKEFFSFLRSLANSYNVAYIVSSQKELREFAPEKPHDSPFFNVFNHIPLGLFDRKSALELISIPSKREGIPLEEYAEFVFELAGFHPFFIQITCSSLFEYLDLHGSIDEEGFKTVKENFFVEAEDHFRYMWDYLEDEERTCLAVIAESEELNGKLRVIARKLKRKGFLQKDGTYDIFSNTFREFILEVSNVSKKNKTEIMKQKLYKSAIMETTYKELKQVWENVKETGNVKEKGKILEDFTEKLLQGLKSFEIIGRNIRSRPEKSSYN